MADALEEVPAVVEVFSNSASRWFVALVVASAHSSVTVRFLDDAGANREKVINLSDPCVATFGTHTGGAPPPGVKAVPSSTRPGAVSFVDTVVRRKFASAELAWQAHLERCFFGEVENATFADSFHAPSLASCPSRGPPLPEVPRVVDVAAPRAGFVALESLREYEDENAEAEARALLLELQARGLGGNVLLGHHDAFGEGYGDFGGAKQDRCNESRGWGCASSGCEQQYSSPGWNSTTANDDSYEPCDRGTIACPREVDSRGEQCSSEPYYVGNADCVGGWANVGIYDDNDLGDPYVDSNERDVRIDVEFDDRGSAGERDNVYSNEDNQHAQHSCVIRSTPKKCSPSYSSSHSSMRVSFCDLSVAPPALPLGVGVEEAEANGSFVDLRPPVLPEGPLVVPPPANASKVTTALAAVPPGRGVATALSERKPSQPQTRQLAAAATVPIPPTAVSVGVVSALPVTVVSGPAMSGDFPSRVSAQGRLGPEVAAMGGIAGGAGSQARIGALVSDSLSVKVLSGRDGIAIPAAPEVLKLAQARASSQAVKASAEARVAAQNQVSIQGRPQPQAQPYGQLFVQANAQAFAQVNPQAQAIAQAQALVQAQAQAAAEAQGRVAQAQVQSHIYSQPYMHADPYPAAPMGLGYAMRCPPSYACSGRSGRAVNISPPSEMFGDVFLGSPWQGGGEDFDDDGLDDGLDEDPYQGYSGGDAILRRSQHPRVGYGGASGSSKIGLPAFDGSRPVRSAPRPIAGGCGAAFQDWPEVDRGEARQHPSECQPRYCGFPSDGFGDAPPLVSPLNSRHGGPERLMLGPPKSRS